MKISYRTAGAGNYTLLGDEADRTKTIRDYRPAMQGLAQVAPMFGSATQFVAALGNRIWTLTFAIERTHATRDAAMDFLASHPLALPDAVDLKIEQEANTVYLTGAVMTGFAGQPEGFSTVSTYTYTGNYTVIDPNVSTGATDAPN